MSLEQQSRVFDPFFTTKPRGVGTGLGLSICLELARAHKGDITCTSQVGKGTLFEVRFPPIRQDSIPPAPSLPPETATYRARVLLIDDEPNIRQVYSILLSDDFEVDVAASGQQGREKVEANPDYDVVVCDVMMPDMDAAELIDAIGAEHPELLNRFVLYTGGAVTERARALVDSGRFKILYKPLPADELKVAIREKVAENAVG
jgi:CheY-like chemotaxis protein